MDKTLIEAEFESWIEFTRGVRMNKTGGEFVRIAAQSLNMMSANKLAAFIYDYSNSNYFYVNDYFTELMGRTREEIMATGIHVLQERVLADDFLKCLSITQKVLHEFTKVKSDERENFHFKLFFRIRKPDGRVIWVMQSNRYMIWDDALPPLDIGYLIELLDTNHPLKVIGYFETSKRRVELHADEQKSSLDLLSKREVEVLQLLAQGLMSSQIAEKLFITAYTVKAHRKNIIKKLNVKSILQAVSVYNQANI